MTDRGVKRFFQLVVMVRGCVMKFWFTLFIMIFTFKSGLAFDAEEYVTTRCMACHNIDSEEPLVGPGLKGVTERRSEDWIVKFIQNSQAVIQSGDEQAVALFEEWDKRIMPAHDVSDEEAKAIIEFIASGGVSSKEEAAVVASVEDENLQPRAGLDSQAGQTLLVVLAVIAGLTFALLVFFYGGIYLKGAFFGLIALSVLAGGVYEVVMFAKSTDYTTGYAPEQPIKFSHKVHAGDNEISCLYCHYGADKGRHGTIPPVNLCMNCHSYVKTDSEEVQKIYEAIDQERSIEWEKVHHLPDFAAFNHSVHVNSEKVSCQDCHGPVEEMDIVKQVHNLSMGFCLNCHRAHDPAFAEDAEADDIPGTLFNCATCHY